VAREEAWEHLIQFFINNEALCSLELELRWDVGNHRELVSSLRRFASLREVNLYNHSSRNGGARVDYVIDALIEHHTGLEKLTIKGMDIGRVGCSALATSSLNELHLQYGVCINKEGARAFANGLARNTALKVLEIYVETCITKTEWQPIFTAFSTSKVESLIVTINHLTDATAISLSNALLHNTTLKSLSLTGNRNGTNSGWVILATSLREIMLEKLHISDDFIDGMGITAIAESLENNSSLRELDLSDNSIGYIGVTSLSTVLRHPNSALEKLDVKWNSIGDIGINALTNSLLQ
jgi:Ran GTPase-activating protein (RanGAP) involved in mRNA processing and transport